MADEDRADNAAKAELFLNEARWRRDNQIDRLNALERKLVTAFTLNVAVVAVFSASLGIAGGPFPLAAQCLLFVTIALFIVGIALSAYTYLSTAWSLTPSFDQLREVTGQLGPTLSSEWLAYEIMECAINNEQQLRRMGRLVSWAVFFAASTAILAVATAVVYSALRFF